MSTNSFVRRLTRGVLVASLLGSLLVLTSACEEAFSGPSIDSMNVSPASIPRNSVGMTDQFFTITIQVSGFDAPIEDVTPFIATNNREAPDVGPQYEETVTGNTINISGVPFTWFQGLPPDTYEIGAEVIDEDGTSDQRRNLTTVTVEDN